jgi:hypothetical protein
MGYSARKGVLPPIGNDTCRRAGTSRRKEVPDLLLTFEFKAPLARWKRPAGR